MDFLYETVQSVHHESNVDDWQKLGDYFRETSFVLSQFVTKKTNKTIKILLWSKKFLIKKEFLSIADLHLTDLTDF